MKYHICLSRAIDLERIAHDAAAEKCPRHILWGISQKLNATIHKPENYPISALDKIRAKLVGRPEHWALARHLAANLTSEDVVFCIGEDVGIPIAMMSGNKPNSPKISVFFHNIDRPRGRFILKLLGLHKHIDLFMACSSYQINFLKDYLNLPENRLWLILEQTDTDFFKPGAISPNKTRPIIASVGLEKRDYRILAEATKDLDIDVKISGFSKDAKVLAQAFPEVMPNNMSRRFYEWPELRQLYRDADIVVVSLVDNKYAAGVQVLLEGMACRRPVIVTETAGIKDYITKEGVATIVKPGDLEGLKRAIKYLLNNPEIAQEQAEKGYKQVTNYHNSEQYIDRFVNQLLSLSS